MPVGSPGPIDEPVLEHHGGDDLSRGDLDLPQQFGAVDDLVDQGNGGLDLALGRAGDPAGDGAEDARGVGGAEADLDDRQRQFEALDDRMDLRVDRQAAVEHDAGQRREGARVVSQQHPEEHIGAVAGSDEDGAFGEATEDVGQGHRADQQAGGLAVEQ